MPTKPYQPLSDRHFTDSAINIIAQLGPRAIERGISTEINDQTILMLALWTVLRWERKLGLVALERLGVEANAMATDVDWELNVACTEERQRMGPPKLQTLPSGQRGIVVDFQTPLAPLLKAAEQE